MLTRCTAVAGMGLHLRKSSLHSRTREGVTEYQDMVATTEGVWNHYPGLDIYCGVPLSCLQQKVRFKHGLLSNTVPTLLLTRYNCTPISTPLACSCTDPLSCSSSFSLSYLGVTTILLQAVEPSVYSTSTEAASACLSTVPAPWFDSSGREPRQGVKAGYFPTVSPHAFKARYLAVTF